MFSRIAITLLLSLFSLQSVAQEPVLKQVCIGKAMSLYIITPINGCYNVIDGVELAHADIYNLNAHLFTRAQLMEMPYRDIADVLTLYQGADPKLRIAEASPIKYNSNRFLYIVDGMVIPRY